MQVDSPLPTVNPARQHAGTSVMGSSVVLSVDGHNEATAPPKADIPLAYQVHPDLLQVAANALKSSVVAASIAPAASAPRPSTGMLQIACCACNVCLMLT